MNDDHELIHNAVGSWLREAGKKEQKQLLKYFDTHAEKMPRVMLRYAVERLVKKKTDQYLKMGK